MSCLPLLTRGLAGHMNLAIQFWRVCALSPEAYSGTPVEATLLWVWFQTYPQLCLRGREQSFWSTLFFFCRAVFGRPTCNHHCENKQRQIYESCYCLQDGGVLKDIILNNTEWPLCGRKYIGEASLRSQYSEKLSFCRMSLSLCTPWSWELSCWDIQSQISGLPWQADRPLGRTARGQSYHWLAYFVAPPPLRFSFAQIPLAFCCTHFSCMYPYKCLSLLQMGHDINVWTLL